MWACLCGVGGLCRVRCFPRFGGDGRLLGWKRGWGRVGHSLGLRLPGLFDAWGGAVQWCRGDVCLWRLQRFFPANELRGLWRRMVRGVKIALLGLLLVILWPRRSSAMAPLDWNPIMTPTASGRLTHSTGHSPTRSPTPGASP